MCMVIILFVCDIVFILLVFFVDDFIVNFIVKFKDMEYFVGKEVIF